MKIKRHGNIPLYAKCTASCCTAICYLLTPVISVKSTDPSKLNSLSGLFYDCIADLSHKIDEPEQADHWTEDVRRELFFAKPATNILLKLNDQLKLRTIVSGLSYKLSKQTIL